MNCQKTTLFNLILVHTKTRKHVCLNKMYEGHSQCVSVITHAESLRASFASFHRSQGETRLSCALQVYRRLSSLLAYVTGALVPKNTTERDARCWWYRYRTEFVPLAHVEPVPHSSERKTTFVLLLFFKVELYTPQLVRRECEHTSVCCWQKSCTCKFFYWQGRNVTTVARRKKQKLSL